MNNCCLEQKVKCIADCEFKYFFNKPNVIAVGLGYKITRSFNTCQKCIKILVRKKLPEDQLSQNEIIPKTYKGIQTDVSESGPFRFTKLTKRIRPVLGGYSFGPVALFSGSFGCLVTDNHDTFMLSCNHILAGNNKVALGTPIIQPSIADGGRQPKDVVASLSEYVPILFGKDTNYVDCAMAKVLNKRNVSSRIALVGYIKGVASAQLNEDVKKVGKTTELTNGKVTMLGVTINIDPTTVFKDQIITTKMTTLGDSGCVLLNHYNYVLGLAMADGPDLTCYNNITRVLNSLHVLVVTG